MLNHLLGRQVVFLCPGKDGMSQQPSMAHSGQWTEPLALIRALPNCWQCYFRLRPSGQCFALLKIVPDDFLFATIHGAYPLGQLKLLKIVPDDFLFAAIHGTYPSGQCFALLKIVPDDFFFKKQRPHRRKNVIMSQVFYLAFVA